MKKILSGLRPYGKRIAAFALAMTLSLGSVCYRPPKAQAIVGLESAYVSAVTSAYMSSIGYTFSGVNPTSQKINEAFASEIWEFATTVYNFPMDSAQALFETLGEGARIVGNGVIEISHELANLLGEFSNWLIDKLGLRNADGPVAINPVTHGVTGTTLPIGTHYVDDLTFFDISEISIPDGPSEYFTASQMEIMREKVNDLIRTEIGSAPGNVPMALSIRYDKNNRFLTIKLVCHYTNIVVAENSSGWISYSFKGGHARYVTYGGVGSESWYVKDQYDYGTASDSLSSENGVDWSDNVYLFVNNIVGVTSDITGSTLYATLSPDYEEAPTVEEQYSMVIDTGMTFEDEQEMIDGILGGVALGTLTPTFTIENTASGDVTVPDEGEDTEDDDTQASILDWTKTIAQNVKELPQVIADKFASIPQAIADAIAAIFVPDAELCAEITDTFTDKFGFLSTLHDLGTDLLSINADSEPPVIYIHLEDAEGNIDYGGTVKALDMSWYARYKPDVDRILSGFLWLAFLWLLFKRASAIIQGAEMVYDYSVDIRDHHELELYKEYLFRYGKWGQKK